MLFRLFILSLAAPFCLSAATVRLHLFENPSNDSLIAAMAMELQEILAFELRERSLTVEPVAESTPLVHSTDELSVIWGRIVKNDTAIRIESFIETGLSPTVIEKTVEYHPKESLRQNADPIIRRLAFVMDEKYSAMLTVASTPPACSLFIGGRSKGTTPSEFVCPVGTHELLLSSSGYEPIRERIRVLPGNNRYSFDLKREEKARDIWRQWYVYTFISGWAVFAGSFYFHSAYKSDYNTYLSVRSRDQGEYDKYYDSAQRNLLLRNASLTLSFGLIAVSIYELRGRLFL